ncbi:hypothetical protein BH10PSE15_BH10PSE15_07020 [soil metagenome]
MLQIIYISTAAPVVTDAELSRILASSRRINARGDITGLLFFNGRRFLQALEGPEAAVDATIARIKTDRRHMALVVLSRRMVDARDFGSWAMAAPAVNDADAAAAIAKVDTLTAGASANIRAQFTSFARLQAA